MIKSIFGSRRNKIKNKVLIRINSNKFHNLYTLKENLLVCQYRIITVELLMVLI